MTDKGNDLATPWVTQRDEAKKMWPPWHVFPTYSPTEMGWRMGAGEDYLDNWEKEYQEMSAQGRKAYRRQYPAPLYWFWFYVLQVKNLPTALLIPVLLLALITWPIRMICHFVYTCFLVPTHHTGNLPPE
jgi:hypothetical protein